MSEQEEQPVFAVITGDLEGSGFEEVKDAPSLADALSDRAKHIIVSDNNLQPIGIALAENKVYIIQMGGPIIEAMMAIASVARKTKAHAVGSVVLMGTAEDPSRSFIITCAQWGGDHCARVTVINRDQDGEIVSIIRNDNALSDLNEMVEKFLASMSGENNEQSQGCSDQGYDL